MIDRDKAMALDKAMDIKAITELISAAKSYLDDLEQGSERRLSGYDLTLVVLVRVMLNGGLSK